MASEFSFDVVAQFDLQELKNALDQSRREVENRYDFKGVPTEITLNDDDITVLTADTMKLKAVRDILFQKLINRGLSPKVLDTSKEPEPATGGQLRHVMKLMKSLDQEKCKMVAKLVKEKFPKVKSSIQGDTVRISSKSKDDLQGVMTALKAYEALNAPIQFTNYR